MWDMNTRSAVTASHLASKYLSPGGVLILTGSAAAFNATPGMIGYGISKVSTHHLVKSLAESGLPEKARVIGIAPITLDTETNRKGMPDANRSSWTPLTSVVNSVLEWIQKKESAPKSGSIVTFHTQDGKTWVTLD
eukprot:TRINITY_DN1225_c0_g1_i2.p1 TRINITY_DN1225_c0_g1~~TRINITY_DN1225_c0_g1_i2.p1  ORF type:complete len:136 (-),score=13.02 TRINITY_DN1225_c0_g1_i2:113-520(-)